MRVLYVLFSFCLLVGKVAPLYAQKDSLVYTYKQSPNTNKEALPTKNLLAKLAQAENSRNWKDAAKLAYEIGIDYDHQTNYSLALQYFLKSLQIAQTIQDTKRVAASLNSIGIVYQNQQDYNKALAYFEQSLAIKKSINDRVGTSTTLNNMAIIYRNRNQYGKALETYQASLVIRQEVQDKRLIAATLNNIATLYEVQKNYELALEYYQKSITLKEEIADKQGLVHSFNGLASIYYDKKDYQKSVVFGEKAFQLGVETASIKEIRSTAQILYKSYKANKQYDKALLYHEHYKQLNDSIFSVEKTKAFARLEEKQLIEKHGKEMEIAQKEAESDRFRNLTQQEINQRRTEHFQNISQKMRLERNRLKAENKTKELEVQKQKEEKAFQKIISYLILFAFSGASMATFIIFRSKRKEQKTNKALNNTLKLVNEQKKAITDSINYAKRIQMAILPSEEVFTQILPESFVFFQPRNIVSGDFYYLEQKENKIILAAIDCTGHGVPGALMSMMGKEILSKIIQDKNILQANLILDELHKGIRTALKQAHNENRDGMDLALVVIDTQTRQMEFSGAKNPLIFIQNGKLQHIKGDRKAIGGDQREQERVFTQQLITLPANEGTTAYLFSDGFQDQFGGENDKKISIGRMKTLFTEIHALPMQTQKEAVKKYFDDWINAGTSKQMDDILVIGFRL